MRLTVGAEAVKTVAVAPSKSKMKAVLAWLKGISDAGGYLSAPDTCPYVKQRPPAGFEPLCRTHDMFVARESDTLDIFQRRPPCAPRVDDESG
jgi:hypothetical protein